MQKEYRIKKNSEIGNVVGRRKAARGVFFTVYYQNSDNFKCAFSASKKYGNAVERNKAKRWMREITRPFIEVLKKFKIVVVIKKDAKQTNFLDLKLDLEKQLNYIKNKES